MWDLETGNALRTFTGHAESVTAVAVSWNTRLAVSASYDKTLKVWQVESGHLLATFTCDGLATSCTFAGDHRIVAGDAVGHVHLLRLEEPKPKK